MANNAITLKAQDRTEFGKGSAPPAPPPPPGPPPPPAPPPPPPPTALDKVPRPPGGAPPRLPACSRGLPMS